MVIFTDMPRILPLGGQSRNILSGPNFNRWRNTQEWGEHPVTLAHCLGGRWRRTFFQPFAEVGIVELEALFDRVDALWALYAEQLARDRLETEDTLPVRGQPAA